MEKYAGKAVGCKDVSITNGFWKDKQELVEKVTVDAVYNRFDETGRFAAMKCDWKEGDPFKPHIFWESDVTKWIEGAAYFLQKKRNPELEARIDELVDRMEKYQGEDGYLNVYYTVVEPEGRFSDRDKHELYCAGHLTEGAIAYYEATGKRKMLDVAMRYIDYIDKVFRIEHSAAFDTPGHEEIELALMKLYRFTGEERYKLLAEYFVNTRGTSPRDKTCDFADNEYMQSHAPVREQKTAEGHSVRAMYLYTGMADVAMENKEDELAETCETLFENIRNKRLYITGGIGSAPRGESFSYDYDFPEYQAYNETCAAIGLALFSRRMWLINEDGKYADCAENALYNTMLSGMSLSGDKFFYENPIAANPKKIAYNDSKPRGLQEHFPILERVKVFGCSCCPPNLVRAVGSIGDYMYSTSGNTIYAQCYMGGDADISLGEKTVTLKQKTQYPYEGQVEIETATAGTYTLALRIPEWCMSWTITVNGEAVTAAPEKGFVKLDREWKETDVVVLDMAMDVLIMEGNPKIPDLCGRVAFTRGPLVYCAEGMDNNDVSLRDIRIEKKEGFSVEEGEVDGCKMPVITGKASIRKDFEALYRPWKDEKEEIDLKLIPYYAWANRKVTEMTVWLLG